MKLSQNTDFTKLPRAGATVSAVAAGEAEAFDSVRLAHDERQVRRRVVALAGGERILIDLAEVADLSPGDLLVLDDGRAVRVEAGPEELFAVTPRDAAQLGELCWHLGSHHVTVAVEAGRVLVLPGRAAKTLLEGLGFTVEDVVAPFKPVEGVHFGHHHHHDHHHGHGHDHHHGHGHGEVDAFGRKPGDPHYGHNHP